MPCNAKSADEQKQLTASMSGQKKQTDLNIGENGVFQSEPACGIINAEALIIFDLTPFFSPLARQPKNMANYTISPLALWYNLLDFRAADEARKEQ